jgi:hypothetical protein
LPTVLSAPFGGVPATVPPPDVPPLVVGVAASQGLDDEEAKRMSVAGSLFGEELISEKSLDEVILSYLAEDLAEKE